MSQSKGSDATKEGRDEKGKFIKGNQISVGNEGGAPTTYKEEYCQQMIDYFEREPQQTVYKKTYYADGTLKSEEPVVLPEQLPTFQGFAHEIGTTHKTLLDWANRHSEFSEAYARAKALQEKIWLDNGMGGLYNSQFAQFFGKNCLGYKDKTEIESTNINIEAEMTAEERQKKIAELLEK
jgi:hypothetical protein